MASGYSIKTNPDERLIKLALDNGFMAEAISLLDRAQALVDATGECMYEAELLRLRGVLTNDPAALNRALDVATRQGAVMLIERIQS